MEGGRCQVVFVVHSVCPLKNSLYAATLLRTFPNFTTDMVGHLQVPKAFKLRALHGAIGMYWLHKP
eukprot:1089002-Amphidinium_carterae.1